MFEYPRSAHRYGDATVSMVRGEDADFLKVVGPNPGFSGTCPAGEGYFPLDHANTALLRRLFPFCAPKPVLTNVRTVGVGFVRMVSAAYNWFAEQRADEAKQRAEGDEQRASSKERKARIACITSIARTRGLGAAPAYSATKRMQAHYLECLSQQARMRHLNIGITDIRPGFVATDLIAGSHFPLQLKAEDVARTIVRAIERGSEVVTIDWRYRLLVAAWQLIPRWLWVRLTAIK
mgnify:CR=1 FL=1